MNNAAGRKSLAVEPVRSAHATGLAPSFGNGHQDIGAEFEIQLFTLGSGTAPKRGLVAATQLVLRERLGARKYRVAIVALGVLCAGLVALYVVTKKDQLEALRASISIQSSADFNGSVCNYPDSDA